MVTWFGEPFITQTSLIDTEHFRALEMPVSILNLQEKDPGRCSTECVQTSNVVFQSTCYYGKELGKTQVSAPFAQMYHGRRGQTSSPR